MTRTQKRRLLRRSLLLIFLLVCLAFSLKLGTPHIAKAAPLCSECIANYPWPYGNHCPGAPFLTPQEQYACQGCWHSCVVDYGSHTPGTDSSACVDQFTAEFESDDFTCQSIYYYGNPAPAVCNNAQQCSTITGRQCMHYECLCPNGV